MVARTSPADRNAPPKALPGRAAARDHQPDILSPVAMMRITVFWSLAGFSLVAALVGCSGSATTDGPGGSLGGSGNAGGSPAAGSGGVGGSGVGGSGVGGSGVGGSGLGGSAGKGGAGGSAGAAGSGGSGIVCGARAGNTCSASEYCAYTVGQMCGAADDSATCQPRPSACDDIYMPVCGCDNKTYPSSCDAAMHGQGVSTAGVCAAPPAR